MGFTRSDLWDMDDRELMFWHDQLAALQAETEKAP